MFKRTRNLTNFLILSSVIMTGALQAKGQDHQLIGSFPDSKIYKHQALEYDEYVIATGPKVDGEIAHIVAEGKLTNIVYRAKKTNSVVQIERNYQQALLDQGFEILFQCRQEKCGAYFPKTLYTKMNRDTSTILDVYNMPPKPTGFSQFRYLSAKGNINDQTIYVSLLLVKEGSSAPKYHLTVVESEQLKTGLVSITTEVLVESIAATGKVVLDGIYFDTNKAKIKSESTASLDIIGKYLQQNSANKFYVVGHTDSKGAMAYNKNLSQRRASAVEKHLLKHFSTPSAPLKLHSIGLGDASPQTSNSTEQGRSENRRVELVLRD